MPFARNVVELLNGQLFANNETGETEINVLSYGVPIRATAPGSNGANAFIGDIDDIRSAETAHIAMLELPTSEFLTDQVVYLRETCQILAGDVPDAAICEIAFLRMMGYRMRLIRGNLDLQAYHVRYNNAIISDPAALNSQTNLLQVHANRDNHRTMIRDWANGNAAHVQFLANHFSNIVCIIAYVFRQKGHHYINGPDYQEAYTRMWAKVNHGTRILNASWELISTVGLHAIVPYVLDQYWRYASSNGRIAAPLALRVNVPCAGTAAPYALLVGWEDARSAYGLLLREHEETYERLHNLVRHCKQHRWDHGINSGYYGIPCQRLDLSQFSSMAATVAGVYEASAERATFLQSKSLQREANGSPLQKDIAQLAARALRGVFVKNLTRAQGMLEG